MKCEFYPETEKIVEMEFYVRMTYKATKFYADGDPMRTETMVIDYNKEECAFECRNDDDYYGQGMLVSFGALKRFKKYLKANGYEVR